MINLKINNIPVQAEEGTTILEAARSVGVRIPTLCYLREINAIGACRICVVEVKGAKSLVAACVYPVSEGMEVFTNTEKVQNSRKMTLELILSDHNKDCLSCIRNNKCELQKLSAEYDCKSSRFIGATNNHLPDNSTDYLIRDNSKCILCRRCVAACTKRQEVAVIGANDRGFDTHIGSAFDMELKNVPCVACGQCITVCPTGALTEKDETYKVERAIADGTKHVVVGVAPSVRIGLGEEFGFPIGSNVEGEMVTALRMLGFDRVFDVNFTADLTIMEEGYEFLDRLNNGGKLPMITSCSPGWIKYIEHYYPQYLDHLSTCKSPMSMYGAVSKTYYAEKFGLDPKSVYTVAIMPCTAKKFERTRTELSGAGLPDIDAVLTVRELARLIKRKGIMLNNLAKGEFDAPMGIASSAGLIFGATGGVMEAALRTLAEVIDKKELTHLDYNEVRGVKGIKEATYNLGGKDVKVAVASGLNNAKVLMEKIKKGEADYHFIEIMCCPGGCVNGGGMPVQSADVLNNIDIRAERAKAIYSADSQTKIRKSHENPAIKAIYKEYFEKPNSHKAHNILHTTYTKREKYTK
jgi:NADP-reducing hydrogenase subunit HndD